MDQESHQHQITAAAGPVPSDTDVIPPTPRATERDVLQRALAGLYHRFGARGMVVAATAAGVTVSIVTTLVTVIVGARYLRLSTERTLALMAFGAPVAIAASLAGLVATRGELRAMLAWSGDRRDAAHAPRAWNAAVRAPRLVVTRGTLVFGVMLLPATIGGVAVLDEPAWATIPILLGEATAATANWVLVMFGVDLLHRPLLEDIAAHLPADFDPTVNAWRLRTKTVAPLPVVTLIAALQAGAFVDSTASGPVRLTLSLGIALATAAVAGVIFLIVTRSVLDPLDELSAATRRVRAGDLSTPVPVLTADDLGSLASDFNRMLTGLRERESLHAQNAELDAALSRSLEDVRESRARIVTASDAARRRVERDLHDGAQQHLVLLNLKLALVKRAVESNAATAAALVDEARADLARALDELRDLAHGIYPALLESDGLHGALADAVERATIPVRLECDGAGRYPRELEAAVYFCCLEALQNTAKHAGERARVTVRLAERDGMLVFSVADDGCGYDAAAITSSAGLQNMADRIGALGGELRIESTRGRGTAVSGSVPLSDSGSAER